jgi:glucoside 3-dehydrogenase (cytochrome c) hitch-hiker subunit
MNRSGMDRRQAIRTLATGAVGAATSAMWVESLSALARQQAHAHVADAAIAAQDWTPRVLTARQNDAVIALTELIIPDTGPAPGTPGAKAARVNRFVDTVLQGAVPADREKFIKGLAWIDARSKTLFGTDFLAASAAEQTALLTRLSKEGNPDGEDPIGTEFFQAIKVLTINGYYTSEIGLRQELGDDGQLFMLQFPGCTHPEHQ